MGDSRQQMRPILRGLGQLSAGMGSRGSHCPCQGILPPYVLQQIAINGNARQRRSAATTMLLDQSVRLARAVSLDARVASQAGAPRAAAAGEAAGPDRMISDANSTQVLPGTLVRAEGDPETGDPAADEAYNGLGATYDLFAEEFGRDSIDGAGMPLLGSVHYDENYDNAFWDGAQMVFGDGDGELFNRFTISVDVIGHELMHGVTEREAGLIYFSQSGALNESLSDAFGSMVKQFLASEKAEDADWLIGEGLFTDQVAGQALRSMAAPGEAYDDPVLGKDPQPRHMNDYVATSADNGGVHINSGIPNHAFYRLATTLRGYAWERSGRIWYAALLSPRMSPRIGFRGFARLTAGAARWLYGPDSEEVLAVRNAWSAVGIDLLSQRSHPGRGLGALASGGISGPRAVVSSSTSPWISAVQAAGPRASGGGGEKREQRTDKAREGATARGESARKGRTSRA
jgi:Zn-dependent metalloprotease